MADRRPLVLIGGAPEMLPAADAMASDHIAEATSGHGVDIDGVHCKAGGFTAAYVKSAVGNVSCQHNVATALFTMEVESLYQLFAYLPGTNAIHYSAWGQGMAGVGGSRLTVDNSAILFLSLSGADVMVTQKSGITQNVQYTVLKIG